MPICFADVLYVWCPIINNYFSICPIPQNVYSWVGINTQVPDSQCLKWFRTASICHRPSLSVCCLSLCLSICLYLYNYLSYYSSCLSTIAEILCSLLRLECEIHTLRCPWLFYDLLQTWLGITCTEAKNNYFSIKNTFLCVEIWKSTPLNSPYLISM